MHGNIINCDKEHSSKHTINRHKYQYSELQSKTAITPATVVKLTKDKPGFPGWGVHWKPCICRCRWNQAVGLYGHTANCYQWLASHGWKLYRPQLLRPSSYNYIQTNSVLTDSFPCYSVLPRQAWPNVKIGNNHVAFLQPSCYQPTSTHWMKSSKLSLNKH